MTRKHSHYFKDVSHLKEIDIYRVLRLYNVTDPNIGHAIKKLLVAGGRGAGKNIETDIREAIDSLNRYLQMQAEDCNAVPPLIEVKFGVNEAAQFMREIAGTTTAEREAAFTTTPTPSPAPEWPGINVADLRIDTYRQPGKGGYSPSPDVGVRLTHLPTGTTIGNHEERSVHMNKAMAMRELESLLKLRWEAKHG